MERREISNRVDKPITFLYAKPSKQTTYYLQRGDTVLDLRVQIREFWRLYRYRPEFWAFLALAFIGLIPFEVVGPLIRIIVASFLVAAILAILYGVLYTLGWIWSVYRILQIRGGKEWLESGRIGRRVLKLLGHKRTNSRQGVKWILYETYYHLELYVFGLLPLLIKVGIAQCVLNPKPLPIVCLLLGVATRSFLLVYYSFDVLSLVRSWVGV